MKLLTSAAISNEYRQELQSRTLQRQGCRPSHVSRPSSAGVTMLLRGSGRISLLRYERLLLPSPPFLREPRMTLVAVIVAAAGSDGDAVCATAGDGVPLLSR